MAFADTCSDVIRAMGEIVGSGRYAVDTTGRAVARTAERLRSLLPGRRMRSIVAEEVARLMPAEAELVGIKLEERLQAITQTLLALQERINELSTRTPVSEEDIRREMRSIGSSASLTDEEKTLLVTVFRRNIAIQKPEVADAPVAQCA